MGLQQGQAGIQALAEGVAPGIVSLDRLGGLMTSHGLPRYANLAARGYVFTASLQAAVALSTLSATCTGFCLTNPAGSGKNLFLLQICIALATAPAGAAPIHLAANVNTAAAAVTQTTPLTVRNLLLGSGTVGVGLAASATTLPAAPVAIRPIGGGPVAGSSITPPFIMDEVGGAVVLQPGTAVSLGYLTTAISVVASMVWAELPA